MHLNDCASKLFGLRTFVGCSYFDQSKQINRRMCSHMQYLKFVFFFCLFHDDGVYVLNS